MYLSRHTKLNQRHRRASYFWIAARRITQNLHAATRKTTCAAIQPDMYSLLFFYSLVHKTECDNLHTLTRKYVCVVFVRVTMLPMLACMRVYVYKSNECSTNILTFHKRSDVIGSGQGDFENIPKILIHFNLINFQQKKLISNACD